MVKHHEINVRYAVGGYVAEIGSNINDDITTLVFLTIEELFSYMAKFFIPTLSGEIDVTISKHGKKGAT